MFDKLESTEKTYLELKERLYDPDIISDPQKMIEISKKISNMENVYNLYQKYKDFKNQLKEAKEIIETEKDEEMLELAKAQMEEAKEQLEKLEFDLKIALLPQDPNDDKDIYLEIRPAAGGDEAGLFGAELLRMYLRYAELKGRKSEIVENQTTGIGGIKFAMVKIAGDKVYSKLKFESGVHRVQRIPATESQGRIHTSTITVAIMPEVEDVEINIKPEDVEMTTYAASSAGGQHANKTESGVRLIHKPTGTIVTCGEGRSQLQNKEKARKVLKSKIYQMELEKQQSELKTVRLDQVGTGDRSEKIKTYNFPQDRLTDHRIKKSWSNLPGIMEGNIDDMINDMIVENQAMLLSASQQGE